MRSALFSPLKIRGLEFKNRIFVSPMCQYSARNGVAQAWHLVHLGARAIGGAALVMVEATSVTPEGRISPADLGLWNTAQTDALRPISSFIREQGAVPAIQLAHAGRKASTEIPWLGGGPLLPGSNPRAWRVVAPSPIPYWNSYQIPHELTREEIEDLVRAFTDAAIRAHDAGFQVVELHMAHGYLFHEFLSPLSNQRFDEYGGSLENRMRFPLRVAESVRRIWPEDLPLFARISATDWVDGGWDLAQSVVLAHALKERGIDLIDCSSGGLVPEAKIPVASGYQIPFADEIRRQARILTGGVGLITEALQAESIIADEKADAVFLARELLRDPHWPLRAAAELGLSLEWPSQYRRAKPNEPR